jgi:tetratricopeptide (TPR) repeat protein/DNA-binding CsgD family transcriptional regulator
VFVCLCYVSEGYLKIKSLHGLGEHFQIVIRIKLWIMEQFPCFCRFLQRCVLHACKNEETKAVWREIERLFDIRRAAVRFEDLTLLFRKIYGIYLLLPLFFCIFVVIKGNNTKMKDTVRIITIIAGIICILSLTCCKHEASYRSDLLRADSVMDARPDSAYGIVAKVRPDSLDEANRALLCLLSTQAKWKTFQDVKQDTAWDEAIRHFTKQEDYDRLAKCYYYRGVVYEQDSALEKSLESYLQAYDCIKKVKDNLYENIITSYIGRLYFNQLDYKNTAKFNRLSYQAAERSKDSVGMAHALIDLCPCYLVFHKPEESLSNAWKAFALINRDTTDAYYLTIANALANAYYDLKDYKKSLYFALKALPPEPHFNNYDYTPSYESIAQTYYKLKDYDNAAKYFYIATNSDNINTRYASYTGLFEIAKQRNESQEALKYEALATKFRDQVYNLDKSRELIDTQNNYGLQKIEANNQQQQRKKTFIVWGIAVAAILGFGALFIVGYRMKRAERAKRQAVVDEQKKIIHKLNTTLKKETKVSRKVANDAVYVNAVKFLDTMKSNPELVSRWTEADWRQIYVLVDDIDKGNIRAFLNNVEELNERERQVFMLSILGINTKQLGEIFSLAPVTVSNIKLKVKKKIQSSEAAEVLGRYAEQMDAARGRQRK